MARNRCLDTSTLLIDTTKNINNTIDNAGTRGPSDASAALISESAVSNTLFCSLRDRGGSEIIPYKHINELFQFKL